MLPNHAPLVVAEQFGTLATLYPNRIELGLGRAPGTDQLTMRALRRGHQETEDQFPKDVAEILKYFDVPQAGQKLLQHQGKAPMFLFGYLDLAYLVHNSRQTWTSLLICITFCTTYVRSSNSTLSREL